MDVWAVEGGEWLASRPGRFIPEGKPLHCPSDWKLSGPQTWSGRCGVEKSLASDGNRLQVN
jgi:hypothetical protein